MRGGVRRGEEQVNKKKRGEGEAEAEAEEGQRQLDKNAKTNHCT